MTLCSLVARPQPQTLLLPLLPLFNPIKRPHYRRTTLSTPTPHWIQSLEDLVHTRDLALVREHLQFRFTSSLTDSKIDPSLTELLDPSNQAAASAASSQQNTSQSISIDPTAKGLS